MIVFGSLAGEWLGVMQKLGLVENFWFGHQGYEYVDLGRFWQILLFVGLLIWLALMVRALMPALRKPSEHRQLLVLFLIASVAIALFYGAGLMWGQRTHLSMAEYWRWWVVHLWVEGFFEVFATVVIGLPLRAHGAAQDPLRHGQRPLRDHHLPDRRHPRHLPPPVLHRHADGGARAGRGVQRPGGGAAGVHGLGGLAQPEAQQGQAVARGLQVADLLLHGGGVLEPGGRGLFGFLINPPIALYYMQGLNTTPVHGHTALFGVYGMLGIGLMLFVLRGLTTGVEWKDGPVRFAFWAINIGLLLMVLLSVLPIGLAQTVASVNQRRHLVRPLGRVHAAGLHADPALAAGDRRHDLRRGRAGPRVLRGRAEDGVGP